MSALLINIKIDVQEKLELFKYTIVDLADVFEEIHIKIRGIYSKECIEHIRTQIGSDVNTYEELQESDWVAATQIMLNQVKSRSVFLYFEDHRLVSSKKRLKSVIDDFDAYNLDYLCYSFFKASELDVNNILPLGVKKRKLFNEFDLNARNLLLIGKISPKYYTFSLVSMISVAYFKTILSAEQRKYKIFDRRIASLVVKIFPYPLYRKVYRKINEVLSLLGGRLCMYSPSSPFNLEKMWFETSLSNKAGWKFGILKNELFANYDDDNGEYGESLIKRGLYPLNPHRIDVNKIQLSNAIENKMMLKPGENFDCTYYSHRSRISDAPIILISVISGLVVINYQDTSSQLSIGETKSFYSNMKPVISCLEEAEINIKIFDEAFN